MKKKMGGGEQDQLESPEIQDKLGLVMQKRQETTQSKIKEKRIRIRKILIITIIIVIFFIGKAVYTGIDHSLFRNFAVEEMDVDFSNVYADVISIEPIYFVCREDAVTNGDTMKKEGIEEIVCKCISVEGNSIWVTFLESQYPEREYSQLYGYELLKYSSENPMRLFGNVEKASQVVDELELSIGDVFILNVSKKSETSAILFEE